MKVKMPARTGRCKGGFTLMECMVMLPVMAVFLMMAGQFFVVCLHTFSKADMRAAHLSQRGQLMRELRQDITTAPDLQLQGSHGLICRYGKQQEILWLANSNGTVARIWQNGKISPPPQYWPALLPDLHFAQFSPGYLSVSWMRGKQQVTQTFVSLPAELHAGKHGAL